MPSLPRTVRTVPRALALALLFTLLGGVLSAGAASPDAASLLDDLRASRLDPEGAVRLEGVELDTGLARFLIEEGTVFPITPVGEGALELAFLGEGRMVLEPPDEIEAGQLELFTGSRRLDEAVTEAVFVVGSDAAAQRILAHPAAAPDPHLADRAQEIFTAWRESPERRALDVEMALLLDALGEPAWDTYFSGWFRGEDLGQFLYVVQPGDPEQVTLGRFEPLELDEKERRKVEREIQKLQRKGRLTGVRIEDLGVWDTWLSAARTGPDGTPLPETSPFEPERYVLEVDLEGRDLQIAARARVELRAVTGHSRAVFFTLDPELRIESARDGSGRELFFHQDLSTVLVLLPMAPAAGDDAVVELAYGGPIVEKLDARNHVLRNTTHWYPHTGTVDRARYDVTLRRPRFFDVVAAGRRVDGGQADGGVWWERRVVDHPTFGYSFEVGRYGSGASARAGDVDVKLFLDAHSAKELRSSREELVESVRDALVYLEERFGPYPLDELTVVTTPRFQSQSLLGFVTLSTPMMTELMTEWYGWDARAVIAHEVAHQWWGHQVTPKGYRDSWLSEALANYAALLYTRNELELEQHQGPTAYWWHPLLRWTAEDGRPLESVGPIVLGGRLASTKAPGAYDPIVYGKGAVVLDMLGRLLGEESFVKALAAVVRAADFRPVSTQDFVAMVEQATGQDLEAFARQYLYGTGVPEVYVRYDFEEKDDGRWVVTAETRRERPHRYRYRVTARPGGALDVAREAFPGTEVAEAPLVVPVQIALFDPDKEDPEGDRRRRRRSRRRSTEGPTANTFAQVYARILGGRTELRFELPHRPTRLWLDRHDEVLGLFWDEQRAPKRVLLHKGLDLTAEGRGEEAEALLRQALEAPVFDGPPGTESGDESDLQDQGRILDRRIHLALARLCLAQDRDGEAPAFLDRAEELSRKYDARWLEEDLRVLRARLALRRGDPEEAYELLRKRYLRGRVQDLEGVVVLAIAARAVGDEKEYAAALERAERAGVDVKLLTDR